MNFLDGVIFSWIKKTFQNIAQTKTNFISFIHFLLSQETPNIFLL